MVLDCQNSVECCLKDAVAATGGTLDFNYFRAGDSDRNCVYLLRTHQKSCRPVHIGGAVEERASASSLADMQEALQGALAKLQEVKAHGQSGPEKLQSARKVGQELVATLWHLLQEDPPNAVAPCYRSLGAKLSQLNLPHK
eukprot:6465715-Amphidinium_carterae.2